MNTKHYVSDLLSMASEDHIHSSTRLQFNQHIPSNHLAVSVITPTNVAFDVGPVQVLSVHPDIHGCSPRSCSKINRNGGELDVVDARDGGSEGPWTLIEIRADTETLVEAEAVVVDDAVISGPVISHSTTGDDSVEAAADSLAGSGVVGGVEEDGENADDGKEEEKEEG